MRVWIGDLCYVPSVGKDDKVWMPLVDDTFSDADAGTYRLTDGRQVVMRGTAYGDGTYPDQNGKGYGVDSGTIGMIRADDLTEDDKKCDDMALGHYYEIPVFATGVIDDGATLTFGGTVIISTGYNEDDWDDERSEWVA